METVQIGDMANATKVHPWERAGLGVAPFRVVGVFVDIGPHVTEIDGIRTEIGSPGQPMGTCAYCSQGIAECWQIRSADGKKFIVGCDCVRRAYDDAEAPIAIETEAQRQIAQLKAERNEKIREAKWAKSQALRAKIADELEKNPAFATDHPHPYESQRAKGKTLRDYVINKLGVCGMEGVRDVDKVLAPARLTAATMDVVAACHDMALTMNAEIDRKLAEDLAADVAAAENIARNQWIAAALRSVDYQSGFVADMIRHIESGADLSSTLSPKAQRIIVEIVGKTAGRAGTKAYNEMADKVWAAMESAS